MIRCLAIDDEKWALDLLVDNIRQVPFLELIARCKNAMEAIEVLHKEKIDLLFLDIQMPGLSGLQFIQTLPQPPMIIFVTAYNQYAIEGFNVSAVDYLLKPVTVERFIKACNKAQSFYNLKNSGPAGNETKQADHFFVNVEYSLVKIIAEEITFIEGYKDYIKIHLINTAKPVITRMSLKAVEEKLPCDHFVRTHKSYIVSIPKIKSIKRDMVCIQGIEVPVSESYRSALEKITAGNK